MAQPQESCRGQKDLRGKAPKRNSHEAAPGHGVAPLVSKKSSHYRRLRGKRLDINHAGQLCPTKAGHPEGLHPCRWRPTFVVAVATPLVALAAALFVQSL